VLWLQALKLLGARMCILQSTLQPLMAALAGSIFLKQPLAPTAGFGIVAVCAGLALAQFASAPAPSPPPAATQNDWERAEEEAASALVAEEGEGELSANSGALLGAGGRLLLGSCLNLMNLAFDTAGSVITRRYGVGCTTWQINMVRFGSAALMTLAGLGCANAYFAVARPQEARPEWTATAPPQPAKVWMAVGGGALLVTFLAPALSNHALFGLNLGVWSALASLGPVWSVPVLYVLRRERTSGRGLLGAALAVVGAAACSAAARASG
jgi:drug/metabolite transporter (DMT)-like permease